MQKIFVKYKNVEVFDACGTRCFSKQTNVHFTFFPQKELDQGLVKFKFQL